MKALGHCTGITALTSTGWVTITGAKLGLRGEIGNWWSNGELGEHWGTINWSKVRRITKAIVHIIGEPECSFERANNTEVTLIVIV